MDIDKIKKSIRNVPDFPKPGIQFKDITTLLEDPDAYQEVIEGFYKEFKKKYIDVIVGIESRGFIFAAPLAIMLKAKFVLARKSGKLPGKIIQQKYDLEYGTDAIEIHSDSINDGDKVLIVDDLLATGGTANATGKIIAKLNGQLVSYAFLIKLNSLGGAKLLEPNNVFALLEY